MDVDGNCHALNLNHLSPRRSVPLQNIREKWLIEKNTTTLGLDLKASIQGRKLNAAVG